jgi:hypothetical protein
MLGGETSIFVIQLIEIFNDPFCGRPRSYTTKKSKTRQHAV